MATRSKDLRLRSLAFAGLTMAHCQALHRFGRSDPAHRSDAVSAAKEALRLCRDLEEAVFARGLAHELDDEFAEALKRYREVVKLDGKTAPQLRMKSFALNNAADIWLNERKEPRLIKAEKLLWQALSHYQNKVAYLNLAEVAKRRARLTDAMTLVNRARALDPSDATTLNQLAIMEVEYAKSCRQSDEANRYLRDAQRHSEDAQQLAGDDQRFAEKLRTDFSAILPPVPSKKPIAPTRFR